MDRANLDTLKKVRGHIEKAWFWCDDWEISEAIDSLIDKIDAKIKEEER